MKRAVYPGSFDPITNGHLNIISRASKIFDEVIVVVLINPDKKALFTIEERINLIEKVVNPYKNIRVQGFEGLLVDFMNKNNSNVILKGLRSVSDFEYEFQMALMNRKLDHSKETFFMITDPKYSYISSSSVKQVANFGGSLKDLTPDIVAKEIHKKLGV